MLKGNGICVERVTAYVKIPSPNGNERYSEKNADNSFHHTGSIDLRDNDFITSLVLRAMAISKNQCP